MTKNKPKKGGVVMESKAEEKWLAIKKQLEDATKHYKELKAAIEEMDLFMREVVNRTILIVQEMHDAISKLEEKANQLESSFAPSSITRTTPQRQTYTPPTQPMAPQQPPRTPQPPLQQPPVQSQSYQQPPSQPSTQQPLPQTSRPQPAQTAPPSQIQQTQPQAPQPTPAPPARPSMPSQPPMQAQPSTPSQPPMPPMNPRQELINQLKTLFKQRQKK